MASILLVDDDPQLLQALKLLLTSHGHRVTTAEDGVLAMTQVYRAIPDLIILDLGLPGGNGIMVLQRVRLSRRTSAVPVLVLTGKAEAEAEATARSAGATEFLRKPADPKELLAAIDRLLGRQAAA
ncbi:MAG TPA: response regulator [Candidatus Saccharimonadales bacterium]|nr:response regulator [Candidatus Saccharimonadales bacterium]